MGFGFIPNNAGRRFDRITLWATVFSLGFFAFTGWLYLAINQGFTEAYRNLYETSPRDLKQIAASINAEVFDGDDGKQTAGLGLLLTATEGPVIGELENGNLAVNYLYYARGRRTVEVTIKAVGKMTPVAAIIDPAGKILAKDDNASGYRQISLRSELPDVEGYHTFRISANALGAAPGQGKYALSFA